MNRWSGFEWVCPCYFRPKDHHWVMFDGPVDALWIESWEAHDEHVRNLVQFVVIT